MGKHEAAEARDGFRADAMKRLLPALLLCLTAGTCTVPPSPTLVQDGQLIVAGLETLIPMLPSGADQALTSVVLGGVRTGLTDLQSGARTPTQFATLITDEMDRLAPPLLKDFHANQTIVSSVALVRGLVPVIAAEVAAQPVAPKAGETDARMALARWTAANRR